MADVERFGDALARDQPPDFRRVSASEIADLVGLVGLPERRWQLISQGLFHEVERLRAEVAAPAIGAPSLPASQPRPVAPSAAPMAVASSAQRRAAPDSAPVAAKPTKPKKPKCAPPSAASLPSPAATSAAPMAIDSAEQRSAEQDNAPPAAQPSVPPSAPPPAQQPSPPAAPPPAPPEVQPASVPQPTAQPAAARQRQRGRRGGVRVQARRAARRSQPSAPGPLIGLQAALASVERMWADTVRIVLGAAGALGMPAATQPRRQGARRPAARAPPAPPDDSDLDVASPTGSQAVRPDLKRGRGTRSASSETSSQSGMALVAS